ncbi:MAG TPA: ATP-binding protein [Chryseosolibacter sp.]
MELPKRIVYSRVIFSAGIALLASLCGLFLYETYQQNVATTEVDHASLINQKLERIYVHVNEQESALRGFLLGISSDAHNRDTRNSIERLFRQIDSLQTNSALKPSVQNLRALVNDYHARYDSALVIGSATSTLPPDYTIKLLQNGRAQLQRLRIQIDTIQRIGGEESRARGLEAKTHTILATLIGVAASIFSIVIFVLAFYFIDQELKRSQQYVDETNALNEKIAQINKELQHANSNLMRLNNELETKNFQLERYAREISSFTHITSHDMQEPLRKIEFFISVILEREEQNLTDEGKRILAKITQSVLRMRKLFLSMLEFSLTNTADNNIEDFDLNDVLKTTLETLKIYIRDSNANIESENLPRVKGVRYQFQQLFENLVSNAIKFRRKDVIPELQITCEEVDGSVIQHKGLRANTPYYRIDFKDNGTGFDPIYAEKIFDIFQRLVPRSDTFGVGIGLTISRKIAENHKGILVASSKPNQGATFSLFIPLEQREAPGTF